MTKERERELWKERDKRGNRLCFNGGQYIFDDSNRGQIRLSIKFRVND